MKLEKLVGERFRERPADCAVDSYALMVRGGYIKAVSNGIFSSYMPMKRITRKIEQIIREEMDAVEGQEVQFPVVMPGALWQESGRYQSIGRELLRFTDRNNTPMVLGMTHEEAAVHLVREYARSYTKYPFMIYQIQTKFRDEARPRAGLIRVKEFTMKDGYSFHTSQEDLEQYYEQCYKAYETIYARAGIPEVMAVKSDSGMMGGRISHEFMYLSEIGEDSIAICPKCGYKANMEAADCILDPIEDSTQELSKVETPEVKTIEDLCRFLDKDAKDLCKAVVYQRNADDRYIVLFIRGDLEVNETKLTNYLGYDIHPAVIMEESGLCTGFIGSVGLNADVDIVYDQSLKGRRNLVCGANEWDMHYTGLDMERDLGCLEYHDFGKIMEDGICPVCGEHSITIKRGIEVGNIFQLGTKYTKSMNMTYVDREGQEQYPIMGCYGIGVGRLAAAVCEAHHDEYGPVWPMSIAPWQVHLCAVRADQPEIKASADALYEELQRMGVEVLYDDRVISAGVMFADADLMGVPLRVIVSPRNLKKQCVEIVSRDKSLRMESSLDGAVAAIRETVSRMLKNQ